MEMQGVRSMDQEKEMANWFVIKDLKLVTRTN